MASILEKLSLEGKVAIVTGGGTGFGRVIALALARAGANIAVAARRREPLEETAALARELGRETLVCLTDITHSDQVNAMMEEVVQHFGKIDILVNNAGGAFHLLGIPITELTDAC